MVRFPWRFGSALELDEQIQINPIAVGLESPDGVAMALAHVVADKARGDFLEGAEVQRKQPRVRGKGEHQIAHELGRVEQVLVGGIVGDHASSLERPDGF